MVVCCWWCLGLGKLYLDCSEDTVQQDSLISQDEASSNAKQCNAKTGNAQCCGISTMTEEDKAGQQKN